MLNVPRVTSLVGNKYGKLTVDSFHHVSEKHGHSYWLCSCECGNKTVARGSHLKSGNITSCGCARGTHRESSTRLYHVWISMRDRCSNVNNPAYKRYGGRGIFVCGEWDSDYECFREWALNNGYSPDLSIDRRDNDGPYTPQNCRWATPREQANNTRRTRFIEYCGVTMSVSEWARHLGLNQSTLSMRINTYNWPLEKALGKKVG